MRDEPYTSKNRNEKGSRDSLCKFHTNGVVFSATNNDNIGLGLILRPLVQEKDSSTVNHIRLNLTDIQNLLNLCYPHNIMI